VATHYSNDSNPGGGGKKRQSPMGRSGRRESRVSVWKFFGHGRKRFFGAKEKRVLKRAQRGGCDGCYQDGLLYGSGGTPEASINGGIDLKKERKIYICKKNFELCGARLRKSPNQVRGTKRKKESVTGGTVWDRERRITGEP